MSRRGPAQSSAVATAWSVAEMQAMDDELADIRTVDTETDGTTVRVLQTDGSEEDQVGFQVTRPPAGPNAETMFRNRVRDGLQELKRRARTRQNSSTDTGTDENQPDDTDDRTGAEADVEDTTPGVDAPDTGSQTASQAVSDEDTSIETTHTVDRTVGVEVALTERSLAELQSEIDTLLTEQHETQGQLEERINSLESDFTELEERIERVESSLKALAEVGNE